MLSFLTIVKGGNQKLTVITLFSDYDKALQRASPISKDFKYQTIKNFKQKLQLEINNRQSMVSDPSSHCIRSQSMKSHDNQINNCFCVKLSKIWELPIHARILVISKKFTMTWLQVSMSSTCFSNLGEMPNRDLNSKILKDVQALGFQNKYYNCTKSSLLKPQNWCVTKYRRS